MKIPILAAIGRKLTKKIVGNKPLEDGPTPIPGEPFDPKTQTAAIGKALKANTPMESMQAITALTQAAGSNLTRMRDTIGSSR
jgi:hypothetical protein